MSRHIDRFSRAGVSVTFFASVLLATGAHCLAAEESTTFSAAAIFDRGIGRNVQLSTDGSAVELAWGELFEDDGPAAGYSYKPNEEILSDTVWARKDLIVPHPAAKAARLLVAPGGNLQAVINGRPQTLGAPEAAGKYWQSYSVDPAALVAGRNEIVLRGSAKLWIALDGDFAAGSRHRASHPNRSARSADAGRTWKDANLGSGGDLDGEYYVRLFLEHHRSEGSIRLPVIDAGNLAGGAVGPPVTSVGPIRVELDVDDRRNGAPGTVTLRARTGATFVPSPANWSEFAVIGDGLIEQPAGRYVQLELALATTDPLGSPRVRGVTVRAAPERPADWTTRLRVTHSHNAPVVRSAVPFEYEPFDHPRLKAFRERHKLDEVVAGASGEFELVTRLAAWSAKQFAGGHLAESYPAWDALEILKPHADGRPVGGFCQQYNLVFLQACESFGLAGRAVSIGAGDGPQGRNEKLRSGHEVVEIWSNDYRKWVYIDGNAAWYFADAQTNVPLSLWELRERQLLTLSGGATRLVRLVKLAESPYQWAGLDGWPAFLELRLIPRSNFLERRSPLPLNQGMRGWFWTGHHVWSDAATPASLLYGKRLTRRGDFEWTLNHVHCVFEAADTPGELRVHLDTETPGLEAFIANLDGAPARSVDSPFTWKLRPGRNRIDVNARNSAGRPGSTSTIELEWDG